MNEKNFAAFLSVLAASALTLLKVLVGVLTGSLGVLSEALHSMLDLLAAGMTYFAVKISDKPADREHNFGHGKIENLTALVEAVLLLVVCAWVVYEAFSRLILGASSFSISGRAFAVILISIVVDFFRARHLSKMAKKYKSQALEADALHFSTDILSSIVVLLGLIGAQFGYFVADSIAALGVSAIVAVVAFRLAWRAVSELLDTAPLGVLERIDEILKKVEGVRYWHDLRVCSHGAEYHIDVNIHVSSELSIVQAHEISERIESEIKMEFGNSKISVHIEPDDR